MRDEGRETPVDKWITKDEIIQIIDISKSTIQRILSANKCRYRSEEIDTPSGRQTIIMIDPFSLPVEYRERYIAALAGQIKEERSADLAEYSDWQARAAIKRMAKVQEIRGSLIDYKGNGNKDATGYLRQLCIDRDISIHTYYRWDRAEKTGGITALTPHWGAKAGSLKNLNTEQKQFLVAMYGDQAQPKMAECHRMLEDYSLEKGLPAPTIHTTRRFIADVGDSFKDLHRKGAKFYDDKHGFHILRDYSDLKSNAIWCSDHHQINVYVQDYDGRKGFPWLTVWLDLASRKVVGWWVQVKTGNSLTIAGALRYGVIESGIPERVYIDNGKDYRSRMIGGGAERRRRGKRGEGRGINDEERGANDINTETKGILMELGITPIYAWPYHPQSKPAERFFRTLDEQFSKKFEGYRGHNTQTRPERVDEHIKKSKKGGAVMHISELSGLLSVYIKERYNLAPHKGDGMDGRSPNLAWQDKLGIPQTLANPAVLDLLMMPVKNKRVGRIGITLFGGHYYARELMWWKGREVDVRYDIQNLSAIIVFERNGKKICIAESQERMSWNPSKEDIEKLQQIRKAEKKALKDVYNNAVENIEMPDLRKRIKAGHNRYAGPEASVDRQLIEPKKVETRFDDSCQPPSVQARGGGQEGGDEDVASELDIPIIRGIKRQWDLTRGRDFPLPAPSAVPQQGDEDSDEQPLNWKTFPEEED